VDNLPCTRQGSPPNNPLPGRRDSPQGNPLDNPVDGHLDSPRGSLLRGHHHNPCCDQLQSPLANLPGDLVRSQALVLPYNRVASRQIRPANRQGSLLDSRLGARRRSQLCNQVVTQQDSHPLSRRCNLHGSRRVSRHGSRPVVRRCSRRDSPLRGQVGSLMPILPRSRPGNHHRIQQGNQSVYPLGSQPNNPLRSPPIQPVNLQPSPQHSLLANPLASLLRNRHDSPPLNRLGNRLRNHLRNPVDSHLRVLRQVRRSHQVSRAANPLGNQQANLLASQPTVQAANLLGNPLATLVLNHQHNQLLSPPRCLRCNLLLILLRSHPADQPTRRQLSPQHIPVGNQLPNHPLPRGTLLGSHLDCRLVNHPASQRANLLLSPRQDQVRSLPHSLRNPQDNQRDNRAANPQGNPRISQRGSPVRAPLRSQ
jgi:hypothetical protein